MVDHDYEVLRKDPMSSQKRQSAKNDDEGDYEELVSRGQIIPQVHHQAKLPSQKGVMQCEQQLPQNIYDEINEKAHLHLQPHVVGFNT